MEKRIGQFFVIYFLVGVVFAICFALFYHWEWSGFFSPGFYVVIISWPYQAIGFSKDFLLYGLAGKPV
jgi:hypothetical protein